MKVEMIKLNRIKYAYSNEEKEQLLKEGYMVVSTYGAGEQSPEEDSENITQPEPQAAAADNEPAEKKGTKKK